MIELMTPATFIPPAIPLQMFATPCATSSLLLSHFSPSLSAQNLHTAAPSRYVMTPIATPGTSSALASSPGMLSAAGGQSVETSTVMAPTQAPDVDAIKREQASQDAADQRGGEELVDLTSVEHDDEGGGCERGVADVPRRGMGDEPKEGGGEVPGEGPLSRRANHGRHLREKHHPRGRADETLQQRYRQRGHDVAELEKATGEASDAAVEGEARGAHHISLARQGEPRLTRAPRVRRAPRERQPT